MRLGQRLNDIVKRFEIAPPGTPALVPIGGVQTSPMKLTQAYGALENDGILPQVRFLVAVIGAKGNVIGVPPIKETPRVMSPRTASAVLQDLRGPVKQGTARSANSVHALVYGKTGTSSRNEDALFVGLTRDFVGSFWLGYDRPAPMPGVHGGRAGEGVRRDDGFSLPQAGTSRVHRQARAKGRVARMEKDRSARTIAQRLGLRRRADDVRRVGAEAAAHRRRSRRASAGRRQGR